MDVIAIIPLRSASDCDETGAARFSLDGHPLWDLTIEYALASEALKEVIVAYDDDRLLDRLDKWKDRVRFWKRPQELSRPNATTMDMLAAASAHLAGQGQSPDYLMLLEVTHPLRPGGIIDQLISTVEQQPADSVITARTVHYNMWRPGGNGLVRIHGGSDDEAIYEEMTGICSLFSPKWLSTETPFGDEVDVVPIDRFWAAIDVRDEDARWMAEQYYRRLHSKHS